MSPNINNLGESKYLTKNDVNDGVVVTITGYEKRDVSRDSEPPSMKYILKFKECKPLVLNKTNGNRIAHIMHANHGVTRDFIEDEDGTRCPANEQFQNWIGKQIVLWNNPDVEFGGEITGGIRVKAVQTSGGLTPQQKEDYGKVETRREKIQDQIADMKQGEAFRPEDDEVPF